VVVEWYTVSGNRGSSDGHFNLARILVKKEEDLHALYHFEAAADLGHAKAAYNAAHMYRHGKPHFALPSNLTKALYYYRLSEKLGDVDAVGKIHELCQELSCDRHQLPGVNLIPNLTISGHVEMATLEKTLSQSHQEHEMLGQLLKEAQATKSPWDRVLNERLALHQNETQSLEQHAEHLLQRESDFNQRQQHCTQGSQQLSLESMKLKRLRQTLEEREYALQKQTDEFSEQAKKTLNKGVEDIQSEKNALKKEAESIQSEKNALKEEEAEIFQKQATLKKEAAALKEEHKLLEQNKRDFTQMREREEHEFQIKLAEQSDQQKQLFKREREEIADNNTVPLLN